MEDPEVVEIMASDCPASTSKKRRRAQVVPHEVIEIDEDEPAGFVNINEKGSTSKKAKGKLTASNNIWGNQIKDALTQDFMIPASATELDLINSSPGTFLKSPGIGSNNLYNINGGSVSYGFSDFSYTYNDPSYYNGGMGFQAPSAAMDLSTGLGASTPWYQLPSVSYGTSSSLSTPNLMSTGWYNDKDEFLLQQPTESLKKQTSTSRSTIPQPNYAMDKEEDKDTVLEKYRSFKRFDTVAPKKLGQSYSAGMEDPREGFARYNLC